MGSKDSSFVMELATEVYNAAREGKLPRLRMFLEPRSKEVVSKIVHTKTNGATPLIIACRNGHKSSVEFLVDKCSADVEQVGSVTFDGETIDGAPALWCAAAAGYLDIVKYLLKTGSSVNKTTFTNSTPLRAACFDGHSEIVQYLVEHGADIEIANRHGHTCLMISCYKGHIKIVKYLLEKGANVNRKSLKGNTALHDCSESGSLEIMKLLLACQAKMEKDSYGMSPLLAAAVTGHTKVVEYLIGRADSNKYENIDALELLGATYVDKKRDMLGGLQFWKMAMEQRHCDKSDVVEKPRDKSPIAAYENAVEAQTVKELDALIANPDDMRMHALLVRERILGPAHPDTSYYIRYRGAVYADMGQFDRCITLWMYALEMQQKMLEPLCPMTQSSFLSFAELFTFMMTDGRHHKAHNVDFRDMMVVFDKAVYEMKVGMTHMACHPQQDVAPFHRLVVIIMHLICLMCRTASSMTDQQLHTFKRAVYSLIRMNVRGTRGFTPLHLACSKDTTAVGRYPVCAFPSVDVVKLLIEVGASVNAIDLEHNTPLHIAAANRPPKTDIVALLLDKGAHIDARNLDRQVAASLLNVSIFDIVCPLNYLSLQCLAATKVIEYNIPYRGEVPQKLETFILLH